MFDGKLTIVEQKINQTKSGQQLCSINAMFDLSKPSPKLSRTKSKWIDEERIVERPTCFVAIEPGSKVENNERQIRWEY